MGKQSKAAAGAKAQEKAAPQPAPPVVKDVIEDTYERKVENMESAVVNSVMFFNFADGMNIFRYYNVGTTFFAVLSLIATWTALLSVVDWVKHPIKKVFLPVALFNSAIITVWWTVWKFVLVDEDSREIIPEDYHLKEDAWPFGAIMLAIAYTAFWFSVWPNQKYLREYRAKKVEKKD